MFLLSVLFLLLLAILWSFMFKVRWMLVQTCLIGPTTLQPPGKDPSEVAHVAKVGSGEDTLDQLSEAPG